MRHHDIHVGSTYRVPGALVFVDERLGNYRTGTHHMFNCRVIAWTDFYFRQDEHALRCLSSGDFVEPMTLAEFEGMYGTREQQRFDAHLRWMPDLIRSWDDLLRSDLGAPGRQVV